MVDKKHTPAHTTPGNNDDIAKSSDVDEKKGAVPASSVPDVERPPSPKPDEKDAAPESGVPDVERPPPPEPKERGR